VGKLHELLAVEGPLKAQAEKVRSDLATTFEKRRHLFVEKTVTFHPAEEGQEPVTEEQLDLQTTVKRELRLLADMWTKAIDASAAVAETNTIARASVTIEGDSTPIFTDLPATALLELEKRIGELHGLVSAIPTLDPAKGFQADAVRGVDVYRSREDLKTRTKKMQRPIVLYEATKEHPAQTQMISEDIPIGKISTHEWSGLLTPTEKTEMLDRVEAIRRAVKAARARANEADVQEKKIGERLFEFVIEGT